MASNTILIFTTQAMIDSVLPVSVLLDSKF